MVLKNKQKFNATLRKIRYKNFFRDCIKRVSIEGTAYYYFDVQKRNSSVGKYMSDIDVSFIQEINNKKNLDYEVNLYSLPLSIVGW